VVLHDMIATPPAADLVIDTERMKLEYQLREIRNAWHSESAVSVRGGQGLAPVPAPCRTDPRNDTP
jgi:hypothetical protein